jgi:predicted nucleotidyltransferase
VEKRFRSANKLLRDVSRWVISSTDISALAVVGSYARHQPGPDSDIDLVLICDKVSEFIEDCSWITRFGEAKSSTVEDWGLLKSIRIFYTDGKEVEFGFTTREWAKIPVDEGTLQVISNGIIVLVDKKDMLKKLLDEVNK